MPFIRYRKSESPIFHWSGRWPEMISYKEAQVHKHHLVDSAAEAEAHIMAFVLMQTHFHLLVRGEASELNSFWTKFTGQYLKQQDSKTSDPFHLWSEPIRSRIQLEETLIYIYRNPVRAGCCARVEDYPFSSLPWFLGQESFASVIYDPLYTMLNPGSVLTWLNKDMDQALASD
jgi:hypothetical protein